MWKGKKVQFYAIQGEDTFLSWKEKNELFDLLTSLTAVLMDILFLWFILIKNNSLPQERVRELVMQ